MTDQPYANREIDEFIRDLDAKLDRIEIQTIRTNGRVTKLERYLLIVGTISATILFTNGSELVGFIMAIV